MRTYLIVLLPPLLNQYLGFFKRLKDFPVKQLISDLSIESLYVPVAPGAPRLCEQSFYTQPV